MLDYGWKSFPTWHRKAFTLRSLNSHKDFCLFFTLLSYRRYRCEISADAPSFMIVFTDQKMRVVGWYSRWSMNKWIFQKWYCKKVLQRSAWKSILMKPFFISRCFTMGKIQRAVNVFRKKLSIAFSFEFYWIFFALILSFRSSRSRLIQYWKILHILLTRTKKFLNINITAFFSPFFGSFTQQRSGDSRAKTILHHGRCCGRKLYVRRFLSSSQHHLVYQRWKGIRI